MSRRLGVRLGLVYVLVLWMAAGSKAQTPPTSPAFEVSEATIASTQAAIRSGQTTCHAIADGYLARVKAYDQRPTPNPLNSLILLNPHLLEEADACDRTFATTHTLLPLSGIVVVVKDNYDTAGLQTTGGSLALKGFVPQTDATMVARLKAAGALILGKSNMAEWAFSPYVTVSSIDGITRNAYDLSRVPAGSSGGTAAAVAASLAEVGLGTDTGNSIRGPSSHNDLVGIRPTIGLTSRAGIIPLFANNDVGGPMARTVADAASVLSVVAGSDPADPVTERPGRPAGQTGQDYTQFLDPHALRGARIGVFRRYLDAPGTDPEVKAAMEAAFAEMRQAGAVLVDRFDLADYDELTKDLWCGDFQADLNAYLAKHPNAPYPNLQAIVASGLYLPYVAQEIRGAVATPGKDDRRNPCPDVYHDPPKVRFRDALLAAMDRNHLDAVVYPTWSNPPRKVGDMQSPPGDNSQVLSPQTGFPALTVPAGFTHGDLPVGVTFLARAYREDTLIRLAYSFEQTTHHRHRPALFPPLSIAEAPR